MSLGNRVVLFSMLCTYNQSLDRPESLKRRVCRIIRQSLNGQKTAINANNIINCSSIVSGGRCNTIKPTLINLFALIAELWPFQTHSTSDHSIHTLIKVYLPFGKSRVVIPKYIYRL